MKMSLSSDKSSETSTDEKVNGRVTNGVTDDVCRDYLRNVCKRGKRCRYSHPDRTEALELPKQEIAFCHDYQNSVCKRPQCKFVHCTREEEEYFRNTGQFPPTLLQPVQHQLPLMGAKPIELSVKNDAPICKDYLKGECKRAGKCKYKHLSNAEFDYELRRLERSQQMQNRARFEGFEPDLMDRFDHEVKRRRLDYEEMDRYPLQSRPFTADYKLLEEENLMLRRRIEELRKQVTDLAATNEVLLEQNARFRVGKTSLTLPAVVTSTTPPSVVTGQVVTPTISPAPIVASSITLPRMPVLHTSLTRQISSLQAPPLALNAMTSELAASQQVIHQQIELAQELAASQNMNPVAEPMNAASLVPAPVSMQQQQNMQQQPLLQPMTSISRVSVQQSMPQASMPQRSMAQIRMSGPVTAPMVTYPPIMSQGGHRHTTSMS